MESTLIIILLFFVIIVLIILLIKKGQPTQSTNTSHTTLERFQSIGQLKVFKVLTKEISTSIDHWAGDFGKKYLRWLWREKKMAMIFEYEIEFIYDLCDSDFKMEKRGDNSYKISMPKCMFEINLKNLQFYDEQASRFLPWLLPEYVGEVFGDGFSDDDRNKLVKEAENHTRKLAFQLAENLKSDVQISAKNTLESIARGFDVSKILFEFDNTVQI
ncbi:MAG: DUF4230 domain-containing protein [Cytophagia bacterium]|jgi:hypothetical protein|nr:DUF4230 domain-containing protein [Cytophagia bacterium]